MKTCTHNALLCYIQRVDLRFVQLLYRVPLAFAYVGTLNWSFLMLLLLLLVINNSDESYVAVTSDTIACA